MKKGRKPEYPEKTLDDELQKMTIDYNCVCQNSRTSAFIVFGTLAECAGASDKGANRVRTGE